MKSELDRLVNDKVITQVSGPTDWVNSLVMVQKANGKLMPHYLIIEKLTELIEQTFNREGSLYLACNDINALFTSDWVNSLVMVQKANGKLMPHNLIIEKLTEVIEQTFNREGSLYLACNDKNAFFYF